jgi:hypothetical protein
VVDGSSLPSPFAPAVEPRVHLNDEHANLQFGNITDHKWKQSLLVVNFLFGLRVNENSHQTFNLDSHRPLFAVCGSVKFTVYCNFLQKDFLKYVKMYGKISQFSIRKFDNLSAYLPFKISPFLVGALVLSCPSLYYLDRLFAWIGIAMKKLFVHQ